MAQATFILKEPQKEIKKKKPTLVFLLFRYNGNTIKYSTAQKINPDYWNSEKQRARVTRLFPFHVEFNSFLNKIEHEANNVLRRFLNDNIPPTPQKIKAALDESINKSGASSRRDLISFAEKLIANSTKERETIANYKQTLRNLIEYKNTFNTSLFFDSINQDFYESFMKFCLSKNYSTNTIGGFIKNIKVFMNESFDRGLHKNLDHKKRRFKRIEEESEAIYLKESELQKLYEIDLSSKKTLDRVRDLFIVGCYTGLRYYDLSQLDEMHIIEKRKLKIVTEKTGETVQIPLHKYVRSIMEKYDWKLNGKISNQKFNTYLKELGQMAGLDSNITISTTKGGSRLTEVFRKYELITVHTARRSFATNLFLAGIPIIHIMKITGHRTEKSFLKYIKIGPEENADLLLNHPFFK
jgi:site-specific recombinase XerD